MIFACIRIWFCKLLSMHCTVHIVLQLQQAIPKLPKILTIDKAVLTYFLPSFLPYLLTYLLTSLLTSLLTYLLTYLLTTWTTVLLAKLIGSQLVKKFPTFMEPEGSLPHSHEITTPHACTSSYEI
jgi:hypothetical protein